MEQGRGPLRAAGAQETGVGTDGRQQLTAVGDPPQALALSSGALRLLATPEAAFCPPQDAGGWGVGGRAGIQSSQTPHPPNEWRRPNPEFSNFCFQDNTHFKVMKSHSEM